MVSAKVKKIEFTDPEVEVIEKAVEEMISRNYHLPACYRILIKIKDSKE